MSTNELFASIQGNIEKVIQLVTKMETDELERLLKGTTHRDEETKELHNQGEDTSCYELQGNNANSCTSFSLKLHSVASSQLSISDNLISCELTDSFPHSDNVFVESVHTQVDPIDDQINSSSKINLCPPSVDTCALNASSLSSDIGVDKIVCNNPLFDVDITNDGEMHSVVSWQDRIVIPLEGYQVIENTLWYTDTLSKDGTLVLEDDSTYIGGVSGQKEEDVCSPMSLSFLCDLILYQGLNACGSKCDSICGHILDEVHLCNTFLYYLFAYDDVHTFEWSMILDDKSVNRVKKCVLDPCSWISFHLTSVMS
ncbi:hypothetical protein KY284_010847 [Solanum tuberosum]|nr:hypothetical protein KY284_010847 [Solanum tuberosum]